MVILPNSLEDGLNLYIFPFGFLLANGERLPLVPLYLGSLFFTLDEYIKNIVRFVGCYNVVTDLVSIYRCLFESGTKQSRQTASSSRLLK